MSDNTNKSIEYVNQLNSVLNRVFDVIKRKMEFSLKYEFGCEANIDEDFKSIKIHANNTINLIELEINNLVHENEKLKNEINKLTNTEQLNTEQLNTEQVNKTEQLNNEQIEHHKPIKLHRTPNELKAKIISDFKDKRNKIKHEMKMLDDIEPINLELSHHDELIMSGFQPSEMKYIIDEKYLSNRDKNKQMASVGNITNNDENEL